MGGKDLHFFKKGVLVLDLYRNILTEEIRRHSGFKYYLPVPRKYIIVTLTYHNFSNN